MAYRVVWSPKALEDVEAIASYIFRDSPAYAAAVVEKILDTTQTLTQYPTSGRLVPFGDEEVWEQLAYSYRIIYRIQEQVMIIAVIHGKKQLDKFDKI